MLLRKSLRATRSVARGAAWAATRLLGAQRPPNGFTIQVKTHGGQCLSLDVVRPLAHKAVLVEVCGCAAAGRAAPAQRLHQVRGHGSQYFLLAMVQPLARSLDVVPIAPSPSGTCSA